METLRWYRDALTQPQPAELAALPQPQARGDRAALLSLAVVNVLLLLLCLVLPGCGPQLGPAVGQSPAAAQDGGAAASDLGSDLAPADDCRVCTQTAPSAGMACSAAACDCSTGRCCCR